MGAGFYSLYREIHYIEVHYIEVWVYITPDLYRKKNEWVSGIASFIYQIPKVPLLIKVCVCCFPLYYVMHSVNWWTQILNSTLIYLPMCVQCKYIRFRGGKTHFYIWAKDITTYSLYRTTRMSIHNWKYFRC